MKLTHFRLLCGFVFILFVVSALSQDVQINEVQSDNINTILDEDGDASPWIELYNSSDKQINLQDYGLSNKLDNPFLWTFPQVLLQPKSYLLVYASGKNRTNHDSYHWETLISRGDIWKYRLGSAAIPGNWNRVNYNDNLGWDSGASGFGYGDEDDATVVGSNDRPIQSVYIRKKFTIQKLSDVLETVLHVDYDDGFVAYINGQEIARANLGAVGSATPYYRQTDDNHESKIHNGGLPDRFNISSEFLREGENVLAIQGHNTRLPSSDLTLIPYLTVLLKEQPLKAKGTPDLINLAPEKPELHTNFVLQKSGDVLVLSSPDKVTVDTLLAYNIPQNDSKGLGNAKRVLTFGRPTPGEANDISSMIRGKLNPVQFSLKGGMYNEDISVILSSELSNDVIRFTTDGSIPTPRSEIYRNPIKLTETTVVKAIATRSAYQNSDLALQSYFINESTQLPILSITFNPSDLFNSSTGIYVPGNNASTIWPYANANYWLNIQKPIQLDYFDEAGLHQFTASGKTSITGKESRTYAQKSLSIDLEPNTENYPLFPGNPVSELSSFTLSNGDDDWAHTLISEAVMQNLVKDIDLDTRHRKPCIVYFNGDYWGIHEIREDFNPQFFKNRAEINEAKLTHLAYNMNLTPTVHLGEAKPYELLWNKANNTVTFTDAKVQEIQKDIDTKNLINYFIFQIYIANTEWPGKNQSYWHGGKANSKWRWIPDDFDRGFGLALHGDKQYAFYNPQAYLHPTLNKVLVPSNNQSINPYYSSVFLRRLLTNDAFKNIFINTFADRLNTVFLPDVVKNEINLQADKIAPEITSHYERWRSDLIGNKGSEWQSSLEWDLRIESLMDFAEKRPDELFKQLSQEFNISEKEATVELCVNNPAGGTIQLNSLNISVFPWKGRYFEDVPVNIKAMPKAGYEFDGWVENLGTDAEITLLPQLATKATAKFKKAEGWKHNEIVINEINYSADGDESAGEWIELFNAGSSPEDLSGWKLISENSGPEFEFPDAFVLMPKTYIVVCNNIRNFVNLHPKTYNIIGETDFELGNAGGIIKLVTNTGLTIDSLSYGTTAPWPYTANANEATLALISPYAENTQAKQWRVALENGTPGEANFDFYTKLSLAKENAEALMYPNPFNDILKIRFNVQTKAKVELVFYDQMGRIIASQLHKNMAIGSQELEWDGTTNDGSYLPGGIYMCRIAIGNSSQTYRINLIR